MDMSTEVDVIHFLSLTLYPKGHKSLREREL
jgi:hypothetical protein